MNKFIFLDFETNGFNKKDSVLSLTMIKTKPILNNNILQMKEIDRFSRYYHLEPGHKENINAIKVNGLTMDEINIRRKDKNYARHYTKDKSDIKIFNSDVSGYICHNTRFDLKFLPFKAGHSFCTMQNLTQYCQLYNKKGLKYPRLSEAMQKLNISPKNIESDLNFHNSLFDTLCTIKIFEAAYNNTNTKIQDKILEFLGI